MSVGHSLFKHPTNKAIRITYCAPLQINASQVTKSVLLYMEMESKALVFHHKQGDLTPASIGKCSSTQNCIQNAWRGHKIRIFAPLTERSDEQRKEKERKKWTSTEGTLHHSPSAPMPEAFCASWGRAVAQAIRRSKSVSRLSQNIDLQYFQNDKCWDMWSEIKTEPVFVERHVPASKIWVWNIKHSQHLSDSIFPFPENVTGKLQTQDPENKASDTVSMVIWAQKSFLSGRFNYRPRCAPYSLVSHPILLVETNLFETSVLVRGK